MNKVDFVYNVVLLPTVTFYNYLPYSIKYKVLNDSSDVSSIKINSQITAANKCNLQNDETENETFILLPGDSVKLFNAKVGSSFLYMEVTNKHFSIKKNIFLLK